MGKRVSTYNITRDKLTSSDFLLGTVANNNSLHGNVTLERSDDIGGLLFLIPTNDSVEHENTDNDTEIDPVTQTSGEQDSQLHNWWWLAW